MAHVATQRLGQSFCLSAPRVPPFKAPIRAILGSEDVGEILLFALEDSELFVTKSYWGL